MTLKVYPTHHVIIEEADYHPSEPKPPYPEGSSSHALTNYRKKRERERVLFLPILFLIRNAALPVSL